MPLDGSNIRQSAYGQADSAASVTVGFPETCDVGNTVILTVVCGLSPALPGGFTQDSFAQDVTAVTFGRIFRLPTTAGTETTWTVSEATATATSWSWRAVEVIGLAQAVTSLAVWGAANYEGLGFNSASLDLFPVNGESGSTQRLDLIGFAFAAGWVPRSPAALGGSAWTPAASSGDIWSAAGGSTSANGSGNNLDVGFFQAFTGSVIANLNAHLFPQNDVIVNGTGNAADEFLGASAYYAAEGSAVVDPIVMGTGFEFGTHHGIVGGPTGAPGPAQIADAVSGTHGTAYQVTTTAPANGTYHLRITAAATTAFVRWSTNTLGTGLGQAVFGGYVKCVSATTNPCVLAEFAPAAGTIVQLVYNTSTTKIGVRWGSGGTVAYQSGTTALGSYAWVDLRAVFNAATWVLAWQCEEGGVLVAQTAPANLTGQTSSTWSTATLGSGTSQTMTADYDDVCLASAFNDYPLRRHKVVLLVPDTAVAAGAGGSAGANMSAITNNAVGSTVTTTGLANIPALLDEVPPNFSATADGVAVVTAATGDQLNISMTSYTATATERIDAVRVYLCGWAASTATASLGLRADAGGSETQFITGSTVHGTFINTTTGSTVVPGWYCKNYPDINGWTQAKLDALRLKFGYSSDATPDIGVLALYAEVAVCTDFTSGTQSKDPVIPLAVGQQATVLREVPGSFTY